MKPNTILEDERVISAIFVDGKLAYQKMEGWDIVAYGEPGQGAYVPWFAIYVDGILEYRVNGATVSDVSYLEHRK